MQINSQDQPNSSTDTSTECCGPDCGCGPSRRETLLAGLGIAATIASPWAMQAMAGPFDREDFDKLVPADKKLHPEWLQSLTSRGSRTTYRGSDLKYIGMPVGGICAGQVYLGGDGRLWLWDIFNQVRQGVVNKAVQYEGRTLRARDGGNYIEPVEQIHPFDQGFAVRVLSGTQPGIRRLDQSGWQEIAFTGEYPIGFVEYHDAASPLSVSLEAFSPFVPLNIDDSSLPVTVLRYTLKNGGSTPLELEIGGWIQNPIGLNTFEPGQAIRRNHWRRSGESLLLECSASPVAAATLSDRADFGEMAMVLPGPSDPSDRVVHLGAGADLGQSLFESPAARAEESAEATTPAKPISGIVRKLSLEPGEAKTVVFAIAWRFPNLSLRRLGNVGRSYAARFASVQAVVEYLAGNLDSLYRQTRLWHDAWYDSTLPFWLLDRTHLNISILATNTCYRFADGRFYAWERVGCCEGTCTHVWHYAQAVARLFPDLERDTRQRVDLGISFDDQTGVMGFRAEFDRKLASDGQAGTLLRTYREHQMSPDDSFLKKNWPRIKKAFEPLMKLDADEDGILEGPQMNTLDQAWYGKIAWLSGLYLAALRAGEQMAREVGETEFADRCRSIADRGQTNIVKSLFNGEYFMNEVDPQHLDAVNSGTGCEIDQVLGQSWAFQVGLDRVLPEKETRDALKSLWEYNFAPDAGAYRQVNKPGRWYAMPGEAGLLMCTFPRIDWDFGKASGKGPEWAAGYFNECMNGFEYQVAGHMLWEGMLTEGLAIARAVHDRYHASRRNPWNEVECCDHYARSMASYGVFLAACGFEHHGPRKHFGFAPRLSPEDFRSAFTAAEGWGTVTQKRQGSTQQQSIELKQGRLRLKTLTFAVAENAAPTKATVSVAGRLIEAALIRSGTRALIQIASEIVLAAGEKLEITLS